MMSVIQGYFTHANYFIKVKDNFKRGGKNKHKSGEFLLSENGAPYVNSVLPIIIIATDLPNAKKKTFHLNFSLHPASQSISMGPA